MNCVRGDEDNIYPVFYQNCRLLWRPRHAAAMSPPTPVGLSISRSAQEAFYSQQRALLLKPQSPPVQDQDT
jgi:hypothetical protein